jgi:UDP-N-acetylglucosamine diphosphorylase/glucosamine-1-phosphate N-acetyltransferase
MHVVIFEGSNWSDFAPLTLTRPVFSLRSGASTLLEKQLRATRPTRLTLWVRPEMEGYLQQYVLPTLKVPTTVNTPLDDEPALILAGRTLHMSRFEPPQSESVVVEEEDRKIRLAYVKSPGLSQKDVMTRSAKWLALGDLPNAMPQTRFPRHWADLVSWNEEALLSDSIHWTSSPPDAPHAHLVNAQDIHAEPDVKVAPGVVLDASKGPILLSTGAEIGANCVIEGPCHIGPYARVTPLSMIRPGTSIGAWCRIGGEVTNSIIHDFSNKSHDGFVGDSCVGDWVNMGAGTTTSNLKGTYGLIKMQLGAKEILSDRVLLGCVIGDHVKTATGTQLSAGGYVGTASVLAITARSPRYVPSFSFWTDDSRQHMSVDKSLDIANRMQARRSRTASDIDRAIMAYAARVSKELDI